KGQKGAKAKHGNLEERGLAALVWTRPRIRDDHKQRFRGEAFRTTTPRGGPQRAQIIAHRTVMKDAPRRSFSEPLMRFHVRIHFPLIPLSRYLLANTSRSHVSTWRHQ